MQNETPKPWKIEDLVQANDAKALTINREYQRGAVWNPPQQKRLIDSVLRGYPLPMIYLLRKRREFRGETHTAYEVIDGQQRINAMSEFFNNKFMLFDPKEDAKEARFPRFIEIQPCLWGRKRFEDLPDDLRKNFLNAEIAVVEVEVQNENEARDLFVRLQAGLPLTAQEKRDAWPGQLPLYIARLAGRHTEAGHPFFGLIKRTGGKKVDDGATPDDKRGAYRQLCAGWLMLFMERWSKGPDAFLDVNNKRIDEFYYSHIDFDKTSSEAKRFERILQKAYEILFKPKSKGLKPYEALHVLLLIDLLLDDYAPDWESNFQDALDAFRGNLSDATKKATSGEEGGLFWNRFGSFLRSSSDKKDSIATRHQFFLTMMYGTIEPTLLDKDRIFGKMDKEYIYYRDKMQCQACLLVHEKREKVEWCDAEFHHVDGYAGGGQTIATNGALVHRGCHPKSKQDVEAFGRVWLVKS